MILPVYIVNAFTNQLFGDNPAAVCQLDTWADMQQIRVKFICRIELTAQPARNP